MDRSCRQERLAKAIRRAGRDGGLARPDYESRWLTELAVRIYRTIARLERVVVRTSLQCRLATSVADGFRKWSAEHTGLDRPPPLRQPRPGQGARRRRTRRDFDRGARVCQDPLDPIRSSSCGARSSCSPRSRLPVSSATGPRPARRAAPPSRAQHSVATDLRLDGLQGVSRHATCSDSHPSGPARRPS
jgi:hypothetical protein